MTRDSQKRKPDATSNNDTTGLVRSSDAGTLVIAVMSSSLFQKQLRQGQQPRNTHADSEAVADVLPLRDAAVALDATAAVLDAVLDAAGVLEDADAVGPMAKDALVARMPLMSDILMKPMVYPGLCIVEGGVNAPAKKFGRGKVRVYDCDTLG
ncbi:hypothetical protein B0H10DRAFT_1951158 [Mycena sp. CBHHK59/15]|nr:hypothetical protein B0H10DRAFT_1951158 [Mycena sp. CBHHK59/15]